MARWTAGFVVLGACAVGCAGDKDGGPKDTEPPPEHTGEPPITGDDDGDGYAPPADCDDADPTVHPDAEERCDGFDTDCDPTTGDPVGVVGRSDGGNHPTISEAVASAAAGSTIWICAGTYLESVTLDRDLVLLGLGEVVVDADGQGPGFDVVQATVSISDVTVEGGTGSPNGPAPENGGGINAFDAGGPLTLTRVTVRGSTAEIGGGLFVGDGGGTVTDCVFEGNVSGTHGGGVFVTGDVTFEGTTIRGNTAGGYGGGLGLGEDTDVTLRDCLLESNDATNGGGVFTFQGAAADLTGTVVADNAATSAGGGLYAWAADFVGGEVRDNTSDGQGGGVYVYEAGSLTDAQVSGNQAVSGAGLYLQGPVDLAGLTVDANVASESGGGAYLLDATVTAVDTEWSGNDALVRAGGVYSVDSSLTGGRVVGNASVDGGGVYVSGAGDGASQLTDVDITDNTATNSGAGVFAATDFSFEDVDLARNVSSDRGGGLYATADANGTFEGGTIFGNAATERGGGVYARQNATVLFSDTAVTFNVGLRGAGFYVNEGATISLVGGSVESNGDLATVTGGGARVTLGTLVSTGTSWGAGPLDNVPDDVFVEVGQAGYVGYEDDEVFSCDENACTPLP